MDNDTKLKAIEWWQTAGYFHPLTCMTSGHEILVGFIDTDDIVKLKCVTCGYLQNNIPDVVFNIYNDRHKIEELHDELRVKRVSKKQDSNALLASGTEIPPGSEGDGIRS